MRKICFKSKAALTLAVLGAVSPVGNVEIPILSGLGSGIVEAEEEHKSIYIGHETHEVYESGEGSQHHALLSRWL